MSNPAAPYEEILRAAAHEAGHGMISAHQGNKVYFAVVHRDGSGITDMDCPSSLIVDLRISLAGYIAEALMEGKVPTFKQMTMMATNEDDLNSVGEVAMDRRVRAEIAIPKAFEYVLSYFQIPSRRRRLEHLAHKMARTRYLAGAYFEEA
jgi:hypothetical protein